MEGRRRMSNSDHSSPIVGLPRVVELRPPTHRGFPFSVVGGGPPRRPLARPASVQDSDRIMSMSSRSRAQFNSTTTTTTSAQDPPTSRDPPGFVSVSTSGCRDGSSHRSSAVTAAAAAAPENVASISNSSRVARAAAHAALPPTRRSSRTKRRSTDSSVDSTTAVASPPRKRQKRKASLKKPPPGSSAKISEEDSKPSATDISNANCCICMEEPKPIDVAKITGCDHLFCFECIEKWSERENTCPLCKVRFNRIDRVNKSKKKGDKAMKNLKRVKQRDQRSDLTPGAALEGLLASFAAGAAFPPGRVARLIFSSGMGPHPLIVSRTHAGGRSSARRSNETNDRSRARAPTAIDLSLSSDSSDSDDATFSDFLRSMARGGGPRGPPLFESQVGPGMQVLRPMSFASLPHLPSPPFARSYATNGNDQAVGRSANIPIEIDDSDDDDDDDVQVIQVTRARR